ncbi:MAG: iron complex transport system ATP-binding protein [Bermanella sp.]|jgi:iron complex transport system ATP-binding protein
MVSLRLDQLIIDIPERADGRALSFSIKPGQRWAVLGPNGAGKTTLLHTLAGLRPARSGQIFLDDKLLGDYRRKQIAQQVAVVFQERHDGFPSTVMETALIGRHPYMAPWDVETDDDMRIAQQALEAMSLSDYQQRAVSTLSGGERQRLAIATAKTQQPSLWLADEPTNHLDLKHQVKIMQMLAAEADSNRSVCMCLHDVNLAARWCSHVLLLYPDGEACWGPTDDMLQLPALQSLYDQQLTIAEANGRRYFVPAEAGEL